MQAMHRRECKTARINAKIFRSFAAPTIVRSPTTAFVGGIKSSKTAAEKATADSRDGIDEIAYTPSLHAPFTSATSMFCDHARQRSSEKSGGILMRGIGLSGKARSAALLAVLVSGACDLLRAEETPPPAFQPGEISIGEPLQLPTSRTAPPSSDDTAPAPETESTPTGNGWIGLTADDSVVTGRLVVVDVDTRGPAARAGIKPDDQLLAINGTPLRTSDQLAAALAALSPGSDVKIAVGRADRIDEVSLKAAPRPERALSREWQAAESAGPAPSTAAEATRPEPAMLPEPRSIPPASRPSAAAAPASPFAVPAAPALAAPVAAAPVVQPAGRGRTALGVRTLPVDPNVQARFHLAEPAGALVIGVVQDLPASKAGVPPGSVIVAIDNQPVRSPNELTKLVTSSPVGTPVTLQYVLPGGESRRAEVSLQSLEVPLERALVGPDR